jgi:DNA-binding NtrC family response regulator
VLKAKPVNRGQKEAGAVMIACRKRRAAGSPKSKCRSLQNHGARPTLVWIDDYVPALSLYKTLYEKLGYQVHTADHGRAGLDLVAEHETDAVIVDYEMPGMNGGDVAASIKNRWPSLPVIMFSGTSLIPERVKALIDAFCDKTGSREELNSTIQRVLKRKPRKNSAATSSIAAQPGRLAVA